MSFLAAFGPARQGTRLDQSVLHDRAPTADRENLPPLRSFFEGRLFNKEELESPLDLAADCCEEDLLLAGFHKWGSALWPRTSGSFSFAFVEPDTNDAVLVRDPMGAVGLYYASDGEFLRVATELSTLVTSLSTRPCLDRRQVARFFALEATDRTRTHFVGVHEVPPGSVVRISGTSVEEKRFWNPADIPKLRARDREYPEMLLELLAQATQRSMLGAEKVGIMLSGGLDSSSIAALADQLARRSNSTVAACSWFFEELASCDERSRIDETIAAGRFEVIRVIGDSAWPLADTGEYSMSPGFPDENAYRGLKVRLYRAAADQGCTTLLNGGPADLLYRGGQQMFLRDLVAGGRFGTAAKYFFDWWRLAGTRRALGTLGRIVAPGGRKTTRRDPPSWLSLSARSCLEPRRSAGNARWRTREVARYLDAECRGLPIEMEYAANQGVRVLSPYLDRDLVEFFLALPANELYRPGINKFVTRQAMRGRVTDSVLNNQPSANLSPLFDRGIFEREVKAVHDLLHGEGIVWPEFVRADSLSAIGPGSDEAEKALLWRCVSFELWRRKHGWSLA